MYACIAFSTGQTQIPVSRVLFPRGRLHLLISAKQTIIDNRSVNQASNQSSFCQLTAICASRERLHAHLPTLRNTDN